MATADHDSSLELGPGAVPLGGSTIGGQAPGSGMWLDGDVLACACPECGAPMSIRLWLMAADCWRCGTSIELTEEQERQALRLLREHEEAKRQEGREAAAAITPTMLPARPASKPAPQREPPAQKRPPETRPKPAAPRQAPRQRRRVAASGVAHGARARIREIYEKGRFGVFWGDVLGNLPAWLVSLVVHVVVLLLLSLWMNEVPEKDRPITLSPSIGPEDLETAMGMHDKPVIEGFEFDDGGAIKWDTAPDVQSVGGAEPELPRVDPVIDHPLGPMPSPEPTMRPPTPPSSAGRMFAGRDPEVRTQLVHSSGGTTQTQAAVTRGLKWLARHQNPDGSWSLHAFHRTKECDGQCRGAARQASDHAGTALALLPFLGAGQTHKKGRYQDEVGAGLNWLAEHQKEDGDLRGPGNFGRMYAHGQAAIALCEAYALTNDDQLRAPAQLALDFIVKAQHPAGGWRYEPRQAGDTSVVGWQLMALNSGRMAHLFVPDETLQRAVEFLDSAQTDKVGGLYAYMPGHGTSHVMTAEALLCRQYLGWPKDHEGLQAGVKFLLDKHLPSAERPQMYYWYYATQVMHHMGGKEWETWNTRMRRVLVDTQRKDGHAAGSWDPRGGHAPQAGRLYMTALAVCSLEVYYRHLPLYSKDAVATSAVQEGRDEVDLFELAK